MRHNVRTDRYCGLNNNRVFKLLFILFIIYYCIIICNASGSVSSYAPNNIGIQLFQELESGFLKSNVCSVSHLICLIGSIVTSLQISVIFTYPLGLLLISLLAFSLSYALFKNQLLAISITIIQIHIFDAAAYSIFSHTFSSMFLLLALYILILYLLGRISHTQFIITQCICAFSIYFSSYDIFPIYSLIYITYVALILLSLLIGRLSSSLHPLLVTNVHNYLKKGIILMAILSTILLLYMDFIYDTAIEYISSNADLTNFSEFIARLFTGGGSTGGSVLSGGSTYSLYGYISYAILGVFILIYLISILVNKENTNSQLDYIILSCFLGLGFFGIIRLLIGSTGFLSFSFTFVCLIIPRIWYLNYRTPLHTKKTFIRISKYFKLGCSVLLILLLITSVTHAVNILDSTSQNNYESLNNAGSYWMENFIPKNSMKYSDFITGGLMNMLLYENKGYTYNTQLTYYSQDIIFKITKTDNTILLNEYLVINPKMISAPATNDDWSQVYPYQMAKSVINHHEINILYSSPILICR